MLKYAPRCSLNACSGGFRSFRCARLALTLSEFRCPFPQDCARLALPLRAPTPAAPWKARSSWSSASLPASPSPPASPQFHQRSTLNHQLSQQWRRKSPLRRPPGEFSAREPASPHYQSSTLRTINHPPSRLTHHASRMRPHASPVPALRHGPPTRTNASPGGHPTRACPTTCADRRRARGRQFL
jgi:hypothetical protein